MPKRKNKKPPKAKIFPKNVKRDHDRELHPPTISQGKAFSMKNYERLMLRENSPKKEGGTGTGTD